MSARSLDDLAFTWSYWHKVIEPWRFDVPTSRDTRTDERAHTIFDRALLHAGETVSMKHILRTENSRGFDLAAVQPASLSVTHIGGGQKYTQPIGWRKTATAGQSAENKFVIPPAAKLGMYAVELRAQDPGKNRNKINLLFIQELLSPVFTMSKTRKSLKIALLMSKITWKSTPKLLPPYLAASLRSTQIFHRTVSASASGQKGATCVDKLMAKPLHAEPRLNGCLGQGGMWCSWWTAPAKCWTR